MIEMQRLSKTIGCLALALSLTGCNGAFWGNLVVLGVTFGIFFGTLSLGRTGSAPSAEASTSAQSSSRPSS